MTARDTSHGSPIDRLLGDPDLTYFDGRYWLYATNDGVEGWVNSTINAFSSTDLVTWVDHGVALDSVATVSWERVKARTWAPAVLHLADRHVIYTAEDGNIAAAVSASPAGPFVDVGAPLVPAGSLPGYQIDPAVLRFADEWWLLWGNGVAHMAPLGADGVTLDLGRLHSWTPTGFTEAIDIKERDGIFHATWSVGDTRKPDYRVAYATAPSPFGPWSDRGLLLEARPEAGILSTGHHSILQVPHTDEWIIAYHRWAGEDGAGWRRESMFAEVTFVDGVMQPVVPSHDWYRLVLPEWQAPFEERTGQ